MLWFKVLGKYYDNPTDLFKIFTDASSFIQVLSFKLIFFLFSNVCLYSRFNIVLQCLLINTERPNKFNSYPSVSFTSLEIF